MNKSQSSISEPLYEKVAHEIARRILEGEYKVDALLPNEASLCDIFGVSRVTVREALRKLADQGIVETRHGVGTFARTSARPNDYIMNVNYTEVMQYGQSSTLQILDRTHVPAEESFCDPRRVATGEHWVRIQALRHSKEFQELPISFLQIFIPERYSSVAYEEEANRDPFHMRIAERYSLPIYGIEQELRATAISDPDLAALLKVEAGSPGLYVVRRFYSRDRELFEVTINTHPADRFGYTLNMTHKTQ